jgi:succinate dehydrogenase/fumarate reductase-like Fe-S protein
MNPHIELLIVLTPVVGYLMALAGLQKNALEWRRSRRVCPSCGRTINTRVCTGCTR